jgi:hypothetical protein
MTSLVGRNKQIGRLGIEMRPPILLVFQGPFGTFAVEDGVRTIGSFSTIVVISACAGFVHAGFVFQNIADTATQFSSITSPSVNSNGDAAFYGVLKSGVSGIFEYHNGQVIPIADTTQGFTSFTPGGFSPIPAINGHGDIAFNAQATDGTTGIYRYSNGVITTVVSSAGGITSTSNSPAMNDAGQVAFLSGTSVLVSNGSGGANNFGFPSNGPPAINNSGLVAFGSTLNGVTVTDGTHPSQASMSSLTGFGGFVAMNNLGTVAVAGTNSIKTTNGTTTQTIATTPTSIGSFQYNSLYAGAAPPINDAGLVAFHPLGFAPVVGQVEGIFLSSGAAWTPVIQTGDALFGSTIVTGQGTELFSGLGLQTNRLSFSGNELGFRYYLANGTQGIAIVQVPEPGMVPAGALVALSSASRYSRSKARSRGKKFDHPAK